MIFKKKKLTAEEKELKGKKQKEKKERKARAKLRKKKRIVPRSRLGGGGMGVSAQGGVNNFLGMLRR